MEERRGARSLMQRRFDVDPETPPPPAPAEPPVETPPSPPTPPPAAAVPPRAPSGDSLRERQLRWLKERAKFEARRPAEVGTDADHA